MKILLITAGAEMIGQSGELDQAALAAAQAWRERGHQVLAVVTDPASPLINPTMTDGLFCTPLTVEAITKVITAERPEAISFAFGGETALNLATNLAELLKQYQVQILGTSLESLKLCEERVSFGMTLKAAGLKTAPSIEVTSTTAAMALLKELKFPVVIRAGAALEGTGVALVYNQEELATVISESFSLSPVGKVWLEASLSGWREFEVELMRDSKGEVLVAALLENLEPVGIHSGNSLVVSPVRGVARETQEYFKEVATKAVQALEIIGGANVQLAYQPENGEVIVIRVKPRFTRSTALATQTSGMPLASLSAWVSLGLSLPEVAGDFRRVNQENQAEPLVHLRLPRFNFERFQPQKKLLDSKLQAFGEVVVAASNFKAALQKGIRALGVGEQGLGVRAYPREQELDEVELRMELVNPTGERLFYLYQAFKNGFSIAEIATLTRLPGWFLQEILELVAFERQLTTYALYNLTKEVFWQAKVWGFSDWQLAQLLRVTPREIKEAREKLGIVARVAKLPNPSGQSAGLAYLTYEEGRSDLAPTAGKVLILGTGPHLVGAGKEVEFALTEAEQAVSALGRPAVLVQPNANAFHLTEAESILYIEPIELETLLEIIRLEGITEVLLVLVTPITLELGSVLAKLGVTVLGMPCTAQEQCLTESLSRLKLHDLRRDGVEKHKLKAGQENVLAEARGVSVTCLSDGQEVICCGSMEQIESARVNPGDSAFALPAYSLSLEHIKNIEVITKELTQSLEFRGLLNFYYLLYQGEISLVEWQAGVNFLTPLLSYGTGTAWVQAGVKVCLGQSLAEQALTEVRPRETTIREVVFPFQRLSGAETVLGSQMRSIGSVCGRDPHFGKAFIAAQLAAGEQIPLAGKIYLALRDEERRAFLELIRQLSELGFELLAGRELVSFLKKHGIYAEVVAQVGEGRPNILDHLKNHQINWVINTTAQQQLAEVEMRATAVRLGVPLTTTLAAAQAVVSGLKELQGT